jgi:CHAT domain-containing protein/tetratricopeptide (TPR) repeat protein
VRLFLASCALVLLGSGAALSQEEEPNPYLDRTREILGHMRDQRTAVETEEYQRQILAWSDSLTAASELVLATQCLERAGILSYLSGDFPTAIDIWDRGLRLARQSDDPQRIGALLNAQAAGVSASGDNVRAILLFRDLVEFRSDNDDRRGAGIALTNLAFSQVALFQYPEAIATLRDAAAIHMEVGNRSGLAHVQITLSELLAHAGRNEEGMALADSAVANSRALGDPARLAPSLHARALRKVVAGDDESALIDFDESVELLQANNLVTMLGATQVNRADVLISVGRELEAVSATREALPSVDSGMDPAQSVVARGTLGRALLHVGQVDEARQVLSEGIHRFFALQDSLADAVQRADANIVATPLSVLPILEIEAGNDDAAWDIVESGLARQLRRSVREGDQAIPLDEFQQILSGLNARALVIGVTSSEGCPVLIVEADRLSGGRLRLDAAMTNDLKRATDLVAGGSDWAILEAPLQRLSAAWGEATGELYQSGAQRLIVMPGGLGGFPFELLQGPSGEFLGDLFDVSYSPSASVLAELESRPPSTRHFLAMADPTGPPADLEVSDAIAMRAASAPLAPLPHAREEARRISPRGGRVLVGEKATASAMFSEGQDASVLHLAMHASVDTQNPHNSALLMAPDAQYAHGVVGSGAIAASRLGVDLVSLSGCSTVGGYQVLGEGTFGLVRAFLEAGSRTVVASRWDVEDGAARRFMELFYERLADGEARDSALGAARRAMGEEGYGFRDRAAFALVGAVSGELPVLHAEAGLSLPLFLAGMMIAILFIAIILGRRRKAT